MAKILKFDEDARRALESGVDKLALAELECQLQARLTPATAAAPHWQTFTPRGVPL